MPDEDASRTVIHFSNQTEVIALDIEDRELSHAVRRREVLVYFFEAFPVGPFSQPKPDVERPGEIWIFCACLKQLPTRDYVQEP